LVRFRPDRYTGLFGFKEQENDDTHAIEKYKDITKKYVSEAHLVLYVMNPTNQLRKVTRKTDMAFPYTRFITTQHIRAESF
jgi:hypothetical protein